MEARVVTLDGRHTWFCGVHTHYGSTYDTKEEAQKSADEHNDQLLPAHVVEILPGAWKWRCAMCATAADPWRGVSFVHRFSVQWGNQQDAQQDADRHNRDMGHATGGMIKAAK